MDLSLPEPHTCVLTNYFPTENV